MDPIKEAFARIKDDMISLREQLNSIQLQLNNIKINPIPQNRQTDKPTDRQTNPQLAPTQIPTMTQTDKPTQNYPLSTHNSTQTPIQTDKPTQDSPIPTHNPTDNWALEALKGLNLPFSTGNRGVPTDKPTDRQTNQQTDRQSRSEPIKFAQPIINHPLNDFQKAQEVLGSLDSIKKEIRLKFKRLTPQEMSVFSTLYLLEDQGVEEITYKAIADSLNLSESSIRDYILKLTSKGIPILKIRQNNKKITLSISPDLKSITNLTTINQLRDL